MLKPKYCCIGGEIFLIYENVKRLAKEKGFKSIRSLEMKAGLGNGVIRGWKSSSPTIDSLKAVADALGASVDELIKEEVKKDLGGNGVYQN
jgi:transcriptional regulator with XRE-family HTH domain